MEIGSQEHGTYADTSTGPADPGQVKEKASQLTRTARQRAMSTLDGQKAQLGGLLDQVAQTAEGDRVGAYAADYARRGAEYLRSHSAEEMLDHLRAGLRARPGLLLSACFVGGLAFARVLKREPAGASQGDGGWRAERHPDHLDEERSS